MHVRDPDPVVCACRLWRSAAAVAASYSDQELRPAPGAQLSSTLLRELCTGEACLELGPDYDLPQDLLEFLSATQLSHLRVDPGSSSMRAAQLDRLLPAWPHITCLECDDPYLPALLPPGLTSLLFYRALAPDLSRATKDVHVLLTRLRQAKQLHTLHLLLPAHLDVPASLAPLLPSSLRLVVMEVDLRDADWSLSINQSRT